MDNLLNYPVTFSIEVGKSYISFDELNNLEVDQCFIVNKKAGEAFFLKINNEIICSGEVVIMDDYFGFRISSIHNKSQTNELPSQIDTMEELLPIEIQFDNFQATINDLIDVSDGTIINLEKKFNTDIDVKLILFGIPIAEGRTICTNENFGIHIKKCLFSNKNTSLDKLIRNSGNRYSFQTNRNLIKHYDYKRPDKFTWAFIKRIELLHQSFVNNLSQNIEYNFQQINISVDQMTFDEFMRDLNNDDYKIFSYKQSFPKTINPGKKLKNYKLFFESKYMKNKLPDEIKEKVKSFTNKRTYEPKMLICLKKTFKIEKSDNEINNILKNTLLNTWRQISNTEILFDTIVNT